MEKTGRYCLHLSELLKTDRVVPVVIFLHPGKYQPALTLQGDWNTYVFIRFIACDLGRIPAERYVTSTNIVARLNLPNMACSSDRRIEMYANAREGLVDLEPNPEKRIKYSEFIDLYAKLDDMEIIRYREEYLSNNLHKEAIMGLTQMLREEGRQEGRQEGEFVMISKQLAFKFRNIPVWAEDLLKKAGQEDLERWSIRILDAKTIEEVFEQ